MDSQPGGHGGHRHRHPHQCHHHLLWLWVHCHCQVINQMETGVRKIVPLITLPGGEQKIRDIDDINFPFGFTEVDNDWKMTKMESEFLDKQPLTRKSSSDFKLVFTAPSLWFWIASSKHCKVSHLIMNLCVKCIHLESSHPANICFSQVYYSRYLNQLVAITDCYRHGSDKIFQTKFYTKINLLVATNLALQLNEVEINDYFWGEKAENQIKLV